MKKNWIEKNGHEDIPGLIKGTKWDDFFWGDHRNSEDVDITDAYDGRGGNDLIAGFDKEDQLWGGGGKDTIYGGLGADKIFGGSGNDTLIGGMDDPVAGNTNDRINGGGGADMFIFDAWRSEAGGSGLDIISDFDPREPGERIHLGTLYDDGIVTFTDLKAVMVQDGENVNMEFDLGRAFLVLEGIKIEQLHANDFYIYYG